MAKMGVCIRARVMAAVFVVALAALPLIASDHIDLDKSEPDVMYLDNPWGGMPIVSSEVVNLW